MSAEHNTGGLSNLFTDFVHQIGSKADYPFRIVQEVLRWTGDQPFLSELLCQLILGYPASFPDGQEEALVEQIVQANIIKDWENSTVSADLKGVIQTILDDEKKDAILNLYLQILHRGKIPVNSSQEQEKLIQSGLVKKENGKLKVNNAIYASIFNSEWVEQQLPDIPQPTSTTAPPIEENQTTSSTRLWSGIALLALLVAAFAYPFLLKSEDQDNSKNNLETTSSLEVKSSSSGTKRSSLEAKLLDQGMEDAKNARWSLMLNNFCQISEDSLYFDDAKSTLDEWIIQSDRPNNIYIALNTFQNEENRPCPIAEHISIPEDILESSRN